MVLGRPVVLICSISSEKGETRSSIGAVYFLTQFRLKIKNTDKTGHKKKKKSQNVGTFRHVTLTSSKNLELKAECAYLCICMLV